MPPGSALECIPVQPVVARPALHHRDLVGIGQPVGEAAALHNGSVFAHLHNHAAVDAAEREFAAQRPDRDLALHAEALVGADAVMHALSLAEQLVAGLDLAQTPDRLVLAAGRVFDIGDRPAGPDAA